MLLELKKKIIYGPVNSRRLGRSLGINILPRSEKMCSFNCLYCQYGWSENTNLKNHNFVFPSLREVLLAVENSLKNLYPPPAYLTFSGNGEPTLHPEFPEIVDGILLLKKKWSPTSKTAILSNSSTVTKPKIKNALKKLDFRIMKLDAGEPNIFKTFNRPDDDIKFEAIISGLSQLKDVTIQALFTTGKRGNFQVKNITSWAEQIKIISPVKVQIYSLDRESPCLDLLELGPKDLNIIKKKLNQEKIQAEVY